MHAVLHLTNDETYALDCALDTAAQDHEDYMRCHFVEDKWSPEELERYRNFPDVWDNIREQLPPTRTGGLDA